MTDKITVSRSEIEKLLTQLNITHQDIRALLDKAAISQAEPVLKMALDNTNLKKRINVLEDLLSSACNIANRNGEDTHWLRFAGQLHIHGISPITPKTFKILPSDDDYKPPSPPADKQDAERYRWLKRYARTILWFVKDERIPKTGREELDEQIDAAMQKGE